VKTDTMYQQHQSSVGNAQAKCINRVALYLTRNSERGPGLTHGLRCFERKSSLHRTLQRKLKRRTVLCPTGFSKVVPCCTPAMGSPTPVIREVSLPEITVLQLVGDVAPFYARFYEKNGPAKVRCWHDVMFSQTGLWRLLSSLNSDTEGRFTLGIISVLLEI